MELVPVLFNLERKNLLPILTVTGTCKNVPMADKILLRKAIQITELSQNQFEGKLMGLMGHEHEVQPKKGMVAIRFYIIFKSDEDVDQAITKIQKELG